MTTTKHDLLALAERCERAEGPDRDLDRAVMDLLRLAPDFSADWGGRDNCRSAPFAYTASLDAAMVLVDDNEITSVLNEAIERLSTAAWRDGQYLTRLRLFVCAAALRATTGLEEQG